MKKNLFYLLLALFIMSSCGGDDDDSSDTFFNCKIDGKDYAVSGLFAYAVDWTNEFSIYGAKSSGESFFFTVETPKKTGTFSIPKDEVEAFYTPSLNAESFDSVVNNSTGSVTVSAIDAAHAEGTFNLVLYDDNNKKINVTDGKFNVKFR